MQFNAASSLTCQALSHACWFSGLHLCSLGEVLHSPWPLWAEESCEGISGSYVWILTPCSRVICSHTSGPVWLFTDPRLPVIYLGMGIPEHSPGSQVLGPLHKHPPAPLLTHSSIPLWAHHSLNILSHHSFWVFYIYRSYFSKWGGLFFFFFGLRWSRTTIGTLSKLLISNKWSTLLCSSKKN